MSEVASDSNRGSKFPCTTAISPPDSLAACAKASRVAFRPVSVSMVTTSYPAAYLGYSAKHHKSKGPKARIGHSENRRNREPGISRSRDCSTA